MQRVVCLGGEVLTAGQLRRYCGVLAPPKLLADAANGLSDIAICVAHVAS